MSPNFLTYSYNIRHLGMFVNHKIGKSAEKNPVLSKGYNFLLFYFVGENVGKCETFTPIVSQ